MFVSQPPLFFALLDGMHGVVNGDPVGMRAGAVLMTLAGALGDWALVRRIAGPRAGLAAVALIVVSPGVVESAAVVSADLPAMTCATAALVAARAGRSNAGWAAVAGTLLATAILIKFLAAVFVVAILAGALAGRPGRASVTAFAAGVAAVLTAVALVYAGALGALYDGAVSFHLDARHAAEIPAPKPLNIVVLMTAAFVGLLTLAVAGVLRVPRARVRAWCAARADLVGLLVGGLVLCAVQRPLLQHHVVSDLPIVPLLAGRPVAPQTADPSYVRVSTGSLSRRTVLAAAEGSGAVVVGRAFTGIPGLERELTRRYGPPRVVDGLQIYATRP